jgi:predicted ATPase
MKSIKVNNLRSFNDSGFLKIKPITIFVGLNSSGKSSFLRIFPLLRQSIEKKTAGPILWYGDFVDFGSFSDTLRHNSESKEITFSFGTEIPVNSSLVQKMDIQYHIGVTEDSDKNTHLSHFEISAGDNSIMINILFGKTESVSLNGEELDADITLGEFIYGNNIIPEINFSAKMKNIFHYRLEDFDYAQNDFLYDYLMRHDKSKFSIYEKIYGIVKKCFNSRTKKTGVLKIISSIKIVPKEYLPDELKKRFAKYKTFSKNISELSRNDLRAISSLLLLANFDRILRIIKQEFQVFVESIRYIAPIRANVERYYRRQDLQVDEVDHTGANIPMVLRSLTRGQSDKFEDWTETNFGFIIRALKYGDQYEVKIRKIESKVFYNIADLGFGYSQMIPIIVSLWLEINKSKKDRKIVFAIEQPELHLHPGYQARITDVICKSISAAKTSKIDLSFVIETHSEALVNRLGSQIENKLISPEDIAIYVFEKDSKDIITHVSEASFDKDGYLDNWPYGFFEVQ